VVCPSGVHQDGFTKGVFLGLSGWSHRGSPEGPSGVAPDGRSPKGVNQGVHQVESRKGGPLRGVQGGPRAGSHKVVASKGIHRGGSPKVGPQVGSTKRDSTRCSTKGITHCLSRGASGGSRRRLPRESLMVVLAKGPPNRGPHNGLPRWVAELWSSSWSPKGCTIWAVPQGPRMGFREGSSHKGPTKWMQSYFPQQCPPSGSPKSVHRRPDEPGLYRKVVPKSSSPKDGRIWGSIKRVPRILPQVWFPKRGPKRGCPRWVRKVVPPRGSPKVAPASDFQQKFSVKGDQPGVPLGVSTRGIPMGRAARVVPQGVSPRVMLKGGCPNRFPEVCPRKGVARGEPRNGSPKRGPSMMSISGVPHGSTLGGPRVQKASPMGGPPKGDRQGVPLVGCPSEVPPGYI
jgi:hypothetical protein